MERKIMILIYFAQIIMKYFTVIVLLLTETSKIVLTTMQTSTGL